MAGNENTSENQKALRNVNRLPIQYLSVDKGVNFSINILARSTGPNVSSVARSTEKCGCVALNNFSERFIGSEP